MKKEKNKNNSVNNEKAGNQGKGKGQSLQNDSAANVFDVLGSYTGCPADGGRPIQDADDL